MELVLILAFLIELFIIYKTLKILFAREENSFDIFLPREKIAKFRFEEFHKKIIIGYVLLTYFLLLGTMLLYLIFFLNFENQIKKIIQNNKVIVYTTDGRYGVIIKKEITKD